MDVGNIVYSIERSDGTMSVNYHKIKEIIPKAGNCFICDMYDGSSFFNYELYTDFEKALDECLK